MRKFIAGALLVVSAFAHAGEVKVLEAALPALYGQASVDARFHMDFDTREGFVKVAVHEQRYEWTYDRGWCDYGPYRHCMPGRRYRVPVQYKVFAETVKVEGLELVDDKVIFHSAEGEVVCGTMGVSRVLRRPTLYLSGKCDLVGKTARTTQGTSVVVTLKTSN